MCADDEAIERESAGMPSSFRNVPVQVVPIAGVVDL